MSTLSDNKHRPLTPAELAIFSMLGTVMFCSKVLLEVIPNVHLLGMFTMAYTLVYRKRALIPIYIYVFLNGIYAGFSPWWLPYTYIWTILWGVTMLLPKNLSPKWAGVVYPVVCALHGFLFGTLYAPAQALMYGLDLQQTIAWIIAGLPWDAVQGVGNFAAGFLILPLIKLLRKLDDQLKRR